MTILRSYADSCIESQQIKVGMPTASVSHPAAAMAAPSHSSDNVDMPR
jgi:hypothetical protein